MRLCSSSTVRWLTFIPGLMEDYWCGHGWFYSDKGTLRPQTSSYPRKICRSMRRWLLRRNYVLLDEAKISLIIAVKTLWSSLECSVLIHWWAVYCLDWQPLANTTRNHFWSNPPLALFWDTNIKGHFSSNPVSKL